MRAVFGYFVLSMLGQQNMLNMHELVSNSWGKWISALNAKVCYFRSILMTMQHKGFRGQHDLYVSSPHVPQVQLTRKNSYGQSFWTMRWHSKTKTLDNKDFCSLHLSFWEMHAGRNHLGVKNVTNYDSINKDVLRLKRSFGVDQVLKLGFGLCRPLRSLFGCFQINVLTVGHFLLFDSWKMSVAHWLFIP